MHQLTLYFAPGACSRVPLIALETIETPFETELVAFMRGDHKAAGFLAVNPSSKIPVLVVDGTPITQNIAILTWLNDVFPEAGLMPPADSIMDRVHYLSLLASFPADLHPLVSRIRVPHFFCDTTGGAERVAEMAMSSMQAQLQPLEKKLETQEWLAGDSWSIVDAYLHWVWFRITGAGFDGSVFPAIAAHYSKTLEQPAVQRAMAREAEAEEYLVTNGLMPSFLSK